MNLANRNINDAQFLNRRRRRGLGGIDSVLGSGDAESIGVRDEDEAVEFEDCEWLREKGFQLD